MIKFEQVEKVYTGREGCMCGCNGRYSVPSHLGVDATDRINDRAVKRAVNRINRLIDWNDPEDVARHVDYNNNGTCYCAWANSGVNNDRVVVVYFVENTRL